MPEYSMNHWADHEASSPNHPRARTAPMHELRQNPVVELLRAGCKGVPPLRSQNQSHRGPGALPRADDLKAKRLKVSEGHMAIGIQFRLARQLRHHHIVNQDVGVILDGLKRHPL